MLKILSDLLRSGVWSKDVDGERRTGSYGPSDTGVFNPLSTKTR